MGHQGLQATRSLHCSWSKFHLEAHSWAHSPLQHLFLICSQQPSLEPAFTSWPGNLWGFFICKMGMEQPCLSGL